ncbi:unnamed protein product, partial [Meganyctiphanes norvegica]
TDNPTDIYSVNPANSAQYKTDYIFDYCNDAKGDITIEKEPFPDPVPTDNAYATSSNSNEDSKNIQCQHCDYSTFNKINFNEHVRSGKCSYCNSVFSCEGTLRLHIEIHTEDLSFQCSSCEKCFPNENDLVQHQI